MAGGGGTTRTEQNADPWEGVQPYLTQLFSSAQKQYNQGSSYYPGQTYANRDSATDAYYQTMINRAIYGSDQENASGNYYSDVLSGKYLGQENPYTKQIVSNLTDEIGSDVGDRFAASGGYMGSPGEHQMVTREVARAAAPYQFQTYNNERNLQNDAAKSNLLLDQLRKGDYSSILEYGKANEQQAQKGIDEAMNRYNYGQESGWDTLQKYSNILQAGTQFSQMSGKQDTPTDWGQVGGSAAGAIASAVILAMLL